MCWAEIEIEMKLRRSRGSRANNSRPKIPGSNWKSKMGLKLKEARKDPIFQELKNALGSNWKPRGVKGIKTKQNKSRKKDFLGFSISITIALWYWETHPPQSCYIEIKLSASLISLPSFSSHNSRAPNVNYSTAPTYAWSFRNQPSSRVRRSILSVNKPRILASSSRSMSLHLRTGLANPLSPQQWFQLSLYSFGNKSFRALTMIWDSKIFVDN